MNRVLYPFKMLAIFLLIVSTVSFAQSNKPHKKSCKHHHHRHTLTSSKCKTFKTKCHTKMIRPKKYCKTRALHTKVIPPVRITCPRTKVIVTKPYTYQLPRKHYYKDYYKDVAPCPPRGLYDGFYLGVAGGIDAYRIRQDHNETFPFLISSQFNPILSAVGTVGGLYAGYGKYFHQVYYAGAEVFGNVSGASSSYTTNINSIASGNVNIWQTKVHVNSNFGISLLPGFKLNDQSLLYVRFGYSRLSLRTNQSETIPLIAKGSNGRTNWASGIAYGVGLETAIYANWSVRGEYTHTEYRSITAPDMILNAEGAAHQLKGDVFFPSNNQFMLGLSYHLN